MNILELFQKMKDGNIDAHSALGSRDEEKQSRFASFKIKKLKFELGLSGRILLFKDIVLPFSPFDFGTEVFNAQSPFRPEMLVSDTIKMLKSFLFDENISDEEKESLKESWKRKGIVYDESTEEATMNDYRAFRDSKYIQPRVLTYPTVSMNFDGLYGFPEYRTKYLADAKLLVDGYNYSKQNKPYEAYTAEAFASILKPLVDATTNELKAAGANKEVISAERRKLFSQSPVGFVSPTNLIPFIFIADGEKINVDEKAESTDFEAFVKYLNYGDKFVTPFKTLKEKPQRDNCIDFYDMSVTAPAKGSQKPNGAGVYTDKDTVEIYTATSVTLTDTSESVVSGTVVVDGKEVECKEYFKNLFALASRYFIDCQSGNLNSFEKTMSLSNGFRPIDSVSDIIKEACRNVFLKFYDKGSPYRAYIDENWIKANSQFLSATVPDMQYVLAAYDQEELEAAEQEAETTIAGIMEEMQEGSEDGTNIDIDIGADDEEEPLPTAED